MHRLPSGQWLVSGRIAGEGLALRETLERSLLIALDLRGAARAAVRPDPRPLCRPPDRRASPRSPTGSARATSASEFPLSRRRRRVRPARPADQRDARPDQRADGGAAAAHRQPRARPALAGQPAALGGPCGGRDQRSRGAGRTARQRHPPGGFADAHPDRGAGDQPLGSADRPQPVRLVRRRRARRRADAKCTSRSPRKRAPRCSYDRPARASAAVRPSPVARPGDQQSHRECDPLRRGGRRDPGRASSPAKRRSGSRSPTAVRAFRRSAASEARAALRPARFEPFDEGAGLGLALAEAIAHLHDGKLLLEDNQPGLADGARSCRSRLRRTARPTRDMWTGRGLSSPR